ncbi:MAG: NYN domain-containing protein [Holophagales bacterium]|nr:NYN domain-containing protein [Holophagales bacterium]
MSPWWLRPPGDEGEEAVSAGARPEAEEATPGVPTIADLLSPSEVDSEEPEEELAASAEGAAEESDASDESEGEGASSGEGEKKKRRRRRRRGGKSSSAAGNGAGEERAERAAADEDDDDDEDDYEDLARELLTSLPVAVAQRHASVEEERKIALFCDLENVALGVRDSEIKRFDIHLVLERLVEKGKIIVKRAYADWERYSEFKVGFHEAAIELIDIPQRRYTGKNSADIKMVVDAMDLCYAKEHLDTFVLLSGDSDFSPLVSKLKENNKYVIGVGVKNSSSNLLIDNCDEFIFYEDVWRDAQQSAPEMTGLTKKKGEVFQLMIESIVALQRENKDVLWGSMIKQTMQRKKPSFNEGYYGYSTFSELLEDAERHKVVRLKKERRSGNYVVTGFARRK